MGHGPLRKYDICYSCRPEWVTGAAGASDELLVRVMRRETFLLSARAMRQSHSCGLFVKMAEMWGKVIFFRRPGANTAAIM